MNRDRSYYRKQRMRAIHRKETILLQLGGEMSLRGNTASPDGCPRGRCIVPAGCAAESRMMIPRFGISGRQRMPPSNCWKSSNFSHEKTLPNWNWQIPAALGQEAYFTPYLTTVRIGTPGNSGFKSIKKYPIPSKNTGSVKDWIC